MSCTDTGSDQTNKVSRISGKDIFRKYCVNCHGVKGNLGLNGAGDLSKSELSFEERVQIIKHGKNTMTAFSTVLSDKEIKKVAEYTISLNKNL